MPEDPRLREVILAITDTTLRRDPTVGDIAEAALRAADAASLRCNICGGIVSYHNVVKPRSKRDA